ncbi:hypothetical protein [Duganella vulcania]|uniref:Uncharacterized protein n=1 Tax=Duganella vulcania TaxID=2692166 RepID=A0A845GG87_9BURK|nr:hypothetical protein [Duganella vulcania]MYM92395.1 hypothetical protein [Duganella vulcania]
MSAIVNIEDPEGLINTLQARIKLLERQIENERQDRAAHRPMEIGEAVKRLRMHGVIPLHIGDQDRAKLAEELTANPLFADVVDQVWLLSAAPVRPEVKDAIKIAAEHGMNRWN